ncbi:unnamed protein product [Ectocarpus sp. CCAP 1310/34]|nr:unnamed protein product [Ectocarpus sp. CCAP 1310/34]
MRILEEINVFDLCFPHPAARLLAPQQGVKTSLATPAQDAVKAEMDAEIAEIYAEARAQREAEKSQTAKTASSHARSDNGPGVLGEDSVDDDMNSEPDNLPGSSPVHGSSSVRAQDALASSRVLFDDGEEEEEEEESDEDDQATSPLKPRNPWRWSLPNLKAAADILATQHGKRKHLDVDEDEYVTGYKSLRRELLADAVDKCIKRKIAEGETSALKKIPAGFTPEKTVKKGKAPAAGKTGDEPERKENFLVLLCCHLANDSTFEGFQDCFTQKSRLSLEDKKHNPKKKWYRHIARDMVNLEYKDDHGNAISVPVNHSYDNPEAPEELFEALDGIDFERTKRELNALYGEDTSPLERQVPVWLRYLAGENTELIRKRDASGGVGADAADDDEGEEGNGGDGSGDLDERAGADGEDPDRNGARKRKDAVHLWNFCDGKLGPFLYHDVMTMKGGGDVSHFGDIVIPDGGAGMGSSIPGGPGHRGMGGGDDLADANEARASRRKDKSAMAVRHEKREEEKLEIFRSVASSIREQNEADAEERRKASGSWVDVAALLVQASQNVLQAQKVVDELPQGCDPQVKACAELALRLRNKEVSDLMEKHASS